VTARATWGVVRPIVGRDHPGVQTQARYLGEAIDSVTTVIPTTGQIVGGRTGSPMPPLVVLRLRYGRARALRGAVSTSVTRYGAQPCVRESAVIATEDLDGFDG